MGSGAWGYVCGDGWSEEEASVACRSLGFPSGGVAESWWHAGLPPALLGRIACSGTEATLDQCTDPGAAAIGAVAGADDDGSHTPSLLLSAWGANYTCATLAAVQCRQSVPMELRLTPEASAPSNVSSGMVSGRVEASFDGGASWAAMCSDGFEAPDAAVACRTLGFAAAGSVAGATTTKPPNGTDPETGSVVLDGLGSWLAVVTRPLCDGGEPDVGACAMHWAPGQALMPCASAATLVCNGTRDSGAVSSSQLI